MKLKHRKTLAMPDFLEKHFEDFECTGIFMFTIDSCELTAKAEGGPLLELSWPPPSPLGGWVVAAAHSVPVWAATVNVFVLGIVPYRSQ